VAAHQQLIFGFINQTLNNKSSLMKSKKGNNEQDKLRDLLNQQTRSLYDETIRDGGKVSNDKLESIGRLQSLIDLNSSLHPPRNKHWPAILILVITLAVVSILLFARVKTTDIELDVSLSELNFRLPREQVFTNVMKLATLGASGINVIQLPRIGNQDARTLSDSSGSGYSMQLSNTTDSTTTGTITLGSIVFPKNSRIWLHSTDLPTQYRLSFKSPGLPLQADINGLIGLRLTGMPYEKMNCTSPRSIDLQSGSGIVDLDLSFLNLLKGVFSTQTTIDSLSFFRVDENRTQTNTLIRQVSTILSGTLYFESLGGQEHHLRPGEEIDFKVSQGEIRTLELKDDHIAFAFHGRVQGMTSGIEEHRYSIMPTYLEWLKARHGLTLLWGTTFYFFGLIYGAWRWWKISK
jgi:hypothetical protein